MLEKVCKKKDYFWNGNCFANSRNKILEFNQYIKSDKIPYIIYADIESLVKKIDHCKNNPEKLSARKIGKHIPCRYSMSTILPFDHIKN